MSLLSHPGMGWLPPLCVLQSAVGSSARTVPAASLETRLVCPQPGLQPEPRWALPAAAADGADADAQPASCAGQRSVCSCCCHTAGERRLLGVSIILLAQELSWERSSQVQLCRAEENPLVV